MTESPHEHNHDLQDVETSDQGFLTVLKTLRALFTGLRLLIIALIISFFFGAFFKDFEDFGGFFFLEEQEEGLLFRFGNLQSVAYRGAEHKVLESGRFYWRWPYPIDDLQRIETKRPITLQNNHFWPRKSAKDMKNSGDFQQGLVPGKDGYLLSGDANIMHTEWKLTYTVSDPKRYYLNFFADEGRDFQNTETKVNNRKQMVQRLLEQAVLQEAARWSVDDLLVLSRKQKPVPGTMKKTGKSTVAAKRPVIQFTTEVKKRLQKTVNHVNLGINIQQVNLTNLQPPNATLQAFNEVNGAALQYKKRLEAAEEFRSQEISQAQGNAAEILSKARSYQSRIVSQVKAEKAYFLKVLEEYRKNPKTMLTALYTDTLQDVLKKADSRFVIHDKDGEQEVRVRIGRSSQKDSGTK